jgi:hypothetical protein
MKTLNSMVSIDSIFPSETAGRLGGRVAARLMQAQ